MKIDIFNTDKKYNIIYADPAWSYKDKALSGNRGACCKYDIMNTEDIKNLPIKNLTCDDAMLFMWITMPKLNEVFDVIESWGFKYKTCGFVWIKKNKKSLTNFMGMGNWTRANAELCLMATKGSPKRISASVHSVIESAIEEHSKKPDECRRRIIELCGDLPKIELFVRQEHDGWDSWGNEMNILFGD